MNNNDYHRNSSVHYDNGYYRKETITRNRESGFRATKTEPPNQTCSPGVARKTRRHRQYTAYTEHRNAADIKAFKAIRFRRRRWQRPFRADVASFSCAKNNGLPDAMDMWILYSPLLCIAVRSKKSTDAAKIRTERRENERKILNFKNPHVTLSSIDDGRTVAPGGMDECAPWKRQQLRCIRFCGGGWRYGHGKKNDSAVMNQTTIDWRTILELANTNILPSKSD